MQQGAFNKFLSELRRRNVYKSALAYVVAGWIILQFFAVTLPSLELPLSIIKWTLFALIIGFPFWLVFSWVYEFTPDGLKKTVDINPADSIAPQTSNRLNKIIIGFLGVAIALLLFNTIKITSGNTTVPAENNTLTPLENSILAAGNVEEEKEKSIAVLAFADMSPNDDQEYFSDGISEEILNLLAKIPDLKVISRTSSFSFKGKDATTAEIGEALNVSHILEGSVRKSGNSLRITAQLINVADGAHLWSETFDRDMQDIFQIQDEIATEVTKELKATLLGGIIKSKEVDPAAYDLCLRAKYEDDTAEGTIRAESFLKQSIAIDSTYAPAWGLLSQFQFMSASRFGLRSVSEALELAMNSAQKAIAIDPYYAGGYAFLAFIQNSNWEFEKAVLNAKKALELEPENIVIMMTSAAVNFASLDKRLELQKKAIALDPLRYSHYYNLGFFLFMDNRLEKAEDASKTYESHYPDNAVIHHLMSRILLAQGKKEAALKEAEKEPDDFWRLYAKNFVVFALGREEEANRLLAEFIENYADAGGTSNIADIYAFRGDVENAFLWLDKALEIKDPTLPEATTYYPSFKVLYTDPRWEELLDKIGLPEGNGVPKASPK
ncbi:MAG TPA: hypothetical protein VFM59_06855 [Salinimicrobium sp.]|nr:hypothetical protein [Salinimicrobium sp.]